MICSRMKIDSLLGLRGILAIAVSLTGCSSLMKNDPSRPNELRLPFAAATAPSDEALEMTFGMARVAERNQRPKQAIAAYEAILKDHPDHVPSLHRLGVIAARGGQIDEAMDFFIQATSYGEPSADLLGDIGYTQYLADDFQAAAATLQKAIHKDPTNNRTVNNLAIVMGMQKRYGDSLQLFRQTGDEAESLAGVAFVQSQTGELAQAKASYHRSLEVDASLDVAANGLVELERASSLNGVDRSVATNRLADQAGENASYQRRHQSNDPRNTSEFTLVATAVPTADHTTRPKPKLAADLEEKSNQRPSALAAVKSFASSVRPAAKSKPGKLVKPPVIAMPPAVQGNTAKIVLATPARSQRSMNLARLPASVEARDFVASNERSTFSIPVAQAPKLPHPHQRPAVSATAQASLPPIVQAGDERPAPPSIPVLRATAAPIRQVGYDQPVGQNR